MRRKKFRTLISAAIVLLVTAIVLPFLMVLRIIAPNVPLCFFSYAMSVSGLGISLYAIVNRSALELRRRRGEEKNSKRES